MFKNNALYYVWHNELTAHGRKLTQATLLRSFVEYIAYFMLLLQHHTIAMHLFHSKEWFPATLYFQGYICIVLLLSFALLFIFWYNKIQIEPNSWQGKISFYIHPIFFSFLLFCTGYFEGYSFLLHIIFVLLSLLYIISFAYVTQITLHNIIPVIQNKSAYNMMVQLYFVVIVSSLITATFLNKAVTFERAEHISLASTIAIPFLLISLLPSLYEHSLCRYKKILTQSQLRGLISSLTIHRKEVFARVGVNLIVGAFLSKWYFYIPLYLQYNENWNENRVANTLIFAGILSLLLNIVFSRVLLKFDTRKILSWFLFVLVVTNIFVGWNLYTRHWIFFSVILMAIFYNSLQNMINRIIYHDVISYSVNLALLLIGNFISIILFGFMCTICSIFMVKYIGVPREISTSIILIVVTLSSLYSFSKLKKYE